MSAHDYYEDYWSEGRQYSDPRSAKRRELVWELAQGHLPVSSNVLEIGCGEGDTIADALLRGHQALGVDIADAAIDRARRLHPGASFAAFSAEVLPWPVDGGAFDLVVALEVIEHLFRPRSLLEGAYSALRPGGMLLLSTPYHGTLKNVAVALRAFERHFNPDGEHIRFPTDRWLERALREAGFTPGVIRHLGRGRWFWANTVITAHKPVGTYAP